MIFFVIFRIVNSAMKHATGLPEICSTVEMQAQRALRLFGSNVGEVGLMLCKIKANFLESNVTCGVKTFELELALETLPVVYYI